MPDPGDPDDIASTVYHKLKPQQVQAARTYVHRVAPDLLQMLGLEDRPYDKTCDACVRGDGVKTHTCTP